MYYLLLKLLVDCDDFWYNKYIVVSSKSLIVLHCRANGRKESCDNLQVCEKLMSGLEANQNCFDIQNVTYTKSDRVQITSMHIFCCRNDHYCNDDEQSFFGDWLNCTQINELTWPPVVEEVGTDATDTAAYKVVSKCATNTIAILYILLMLSVAKLLWQISKFQ